MWKKVSLFSVLLLTSLAFSTEKLDPMLKLMLEKEKEGKKLFSLSTTTLDKVKVLRKDGKVEVIDLRKRSLKSLINDPNIVYIEAPRKLKLYDDITYNSSYVVWGSGNTQISVHYTNPFFGYIYGGSVSGSGCTQTGLFFQCSGGNTINVNATGGFRIVFSAPNLQASDIQGGLQKYLVGTRASASGKTGQGVIAGIIDTGINFCHPAFRDENGNTRILYYKDYDGNEFNSSQINQKIQNGDCNYDDEGHGTAVASVAGGYWGQTRYNSQAKDVKFIIYRTNLEDTDIIAGLDYIRQKAQALGMPVVVNLSLGGHADPHDGTGLFDRYIDQISGPGFVVVVAAGNEGSDKIHARVEAPSQSILITGSSYLIDGWYYSGSLYKVEICDVNNNCVSANPGQRVRDSKITISECYVFIDNTTLSSPLNGDGEVLISVSCVSPKNLTLKLTRLTGNGKMDMWIVEGDGEFECGYISDGFGGYAYTVGSPGTAKRVITVGAIGGNYIKSQYFDNYGKIAFFSSRGPTRDERIKPEVVANGFYVCAANYLFSNGSDPNDCGDYGSSRPYYVKSPGTSFSAPVVSALVALYLQDHPNATPEEVKNWLISNTVKFGAQSPNNAYGYGKAVFEKDATITTEGSQEGSSPSYSYCPTPSSPTSGGGGGGGYNLPLPPPSGGGCSLNPNASVWGILPYLFVVILPMLRKLLLRRR